MDPRTRNLLGASAFLIALGVGLIVADAVGSSTPPTTTTTSTSSTTTTSSTTSSTTTTSTTTTTVAAGPRWLLTGRVDPEADPGRPIVAIKIDNSPKARPQEGLEQADTVFEVLVEGGIARFIALYQSQDPAAAGPVRSAREVDPKLLAPFRPLYAYSGGVASVVAALRTATVDAGAPSLPTAYRRRPDRPSLYDLWVDPAIVRARREGVTPATGPFATVGPDGELGTPFLEPNGEPDEGFEDGAQALTVEIDLSNAITPTYRYASLDGVYLRSHGARPHLAESGVQLSATNVVVLFVRQFDSGRRDAAGSVVPDYEVTGTGRALVARGGRLVEGTWRRGAITEPFALLAEDGSPILLAPGVTWVEVVPIGRSVTWR